MREMSDRQAHWVKKYNYRETDSINTCEICSYAEEVDEDGKWGVEALICAAGTDDTGSTLPVEFSYICDLYLPELLEEQPD